MSAEEKTTNISAPHLVPLAIFLTLGLFALDRWGGVDLSAIQILTPIVALMLFAVVILVVIVLIGLLAILIGLFASKK